MSSSTLSPVWWLPIDKTQKLLLAFLADGANHFGYAETYEIKALANMAQIAPKTVRRALKGLEESGHLIRTDNWWRVDIEGEASEARVRVEDLVEPVEPTEQPLSDPGPRELIHSSPAEVAETTAEHTPPAISSRDRRLRDFCAAWDLDLTDESTSTGRSELEAAWDAFEASEAKHNRNVKHRDDKGETWQVVEESAEDIMPAIQQAVSVFLRRRAMGLPVHAEGPVEFVQKELWLAPDYQVRPETVGDFAVAEKSEAELDAMVQEMNRAGGTFACHLRTSMVDLDTGQPIQETMAVYERRVLAKYRQFQQHRHILEG